LVEAGQAATLDGLQKELAWDRATHVDYEPLARFPGSAVASRCGGASAQVQRSRRRVRSRASRVSIEIGSVHVEPHRSFAQRVRARIDYDGIWQRREWFEQDGIRGYRLSPADAILCHAFYFAMDEFSSPLIRYLDFYLLLQQYENELSQCAARANAWGIERPLFGALHLTSKLFANARTKAVEEAMDLLLDARTRHFLVHRVLPDAATEPSGHVTGRRVQLWRKYSLMDRRWRSVPLLAYYLYEVAIGSLLEWQMRRKDHLIPPRPTTRLQ